MDFGKLISVDNINFTLPTEPAQNSVILANTSRSTTPTLYIGPTGYNMKPWVGKWYPVGAREKDFLTHYSAQFNTIEFNTTHYRMPDSSTVDRWRNAVSNDFRFCPKVPQSISHARDLGLSGPEPQIFAQALSGLGDKLGRSFLQLPPHFSPRELPILARFLDLMAPLTPLSVEVRHPAFFQYPEAGLDLFDLLTRHGVAAVITDVAGRRDVCHLRLTRGETLIRFVGNGLHPSDYSRIDDWAKQLAKWFEQGLQTAYFFTHEPDNLLTPELAAYCFDTFSQNMPGVQMRGPAPVAGQQGTLF